MIKEIIYYIKLYIFHVQAKLLAKKMQSIWRSPDLCFSDVWQWYGIGGGWVVTWHAVAVKKGEGDHQLFRRPTQTHPNPDLCSKQADRQAMKIVPARFFEVHNTGHFARLSLLFSDSASYSEIHLYQKYSQYSD